VESLNKKVHDSVNSCSSLLTLVKEIQQLLDDEANYIRIQEYKDEIPSIGLENVAQRYFASIEKIVSDYLMAPMIIPVCKQMQECFYYDAFMLEITQWEAIIEVITK
jgi:hypothetical protein